MLTDEPFDRSRFARRQPHDVAGVRVAISTPEDTILQKLVWIQRWGGGEKHFGDALRVYEVQAATIDRAYVESWAETLGVRAPWERILAEAKPP